MLSRRLEVQMGVINQTIPPSMVTVAGNDETNGALTLTPGAGSEEGKGQERERAIIKAALSVAEICSYIIILSFITDTRMSSCSSRC